MAKENFGSHANTAHAWAQQTNGHGRANDGRMFFRDSAIYSYGTHFEIARFLPDQFKGRRVVLINADGYSISTTRHKSYVSGALRSEDIVILVPDLTSFSRYTKPSDKHAREVFESLCERVAAALRGEDSWVSGYGRQNEEESRVALDAYRAAFKLRLKVPTDLVAWSDKRKAAAKAKATAAKIKAASQMISTLDWLDKESVLPDCNSFDLREARGRTERTLTSIRSARLVLAKTGKDKFPKLRAKAAALLKKGAAMIALADAEIPIREAAERRGRMLERLAMVRNDPEIKDSGRIWGGYNESDTAALWEFALAEGESDLAAIIGRQVQIERYQIELNQRFPRRYVSRTRPKVTPEEWRAGKGEAGALGYEAGTLLRRKGDRLQTSRGAEAPWRAAVRAFQFAQACRREGKAWHTNGERFPIGPYHLDRVSPSGDIVAGCHSLSFDEMQRLAAAEIPPRELAPTFPLPVPIGA